MTEINVRQATLADVYAITDLHCSSVKEGVFTRRNPDGTRTPAAYEELSLFERYMNGGPWMSVETCAVWLAYLLRYSDEIPLVAVADGIVLGEAEVSIGHEPTPYNNHLNINILRVHADMWRRGLGTALLNYIKEMAAVMNMQQVLVADAEPVDFYRERGFKPTVARREVIIPVKRGRVFYKATDLDLIGPATIEGWAMPFGRHQNARHGWVHVIPGFWNCVPELVEPEVHRYDITLTGQRGILVLEQDRYHPQRAHAYLWTERPLSALMVSAVRDRAATLDYEELSIFVDDTTRALIESEIVTMYEPHMLMAWRVEQH